ALLQVAPAQGIHGICIMRGSVCRQNGKPGFAAETASRLGTQVDGHAHLPVRMIQEELQVRCRKTICDNLKADRPERDFTEPGQVALFWPGELLGRYDLPRGQPDLRVFAQRM